MKQIIHLLNPPLQVITSQNSKLFSVSRVLLLVPKTNCPGQTAVASCRDNRPYSVGHCPVDRRQESPSGRAADGADGRSSQRWNCQSVDPIQLPIAQSLLNPRSSPLPQAVFPVRAILWW